MNSFVDMYRFLGGKVRCDPSVNRREVLFYNVQIGSMSELQILKKMVDYYGKPVTLTFNSLYYTGEQYPVIAEIITQCMAAGFENFIIADPALMLYLRQQKINCGIHLSGRPRK